MTTEKQEPWKCQWLQVAPGEGDDHFNAMWRITFAEWKTFKGPVPITLSLRCWGKRGWHVDITGTDVHAQGKSWDVSYKLETVQKKALVYFREWATSLQDRLQVALELAHEIGEHAPPPVAQHSPACLGVGGGVSDDDCICGADKR